MTRAFELWEWLNSIDPPFAFLLALPFGVAIAGLIGELLARYRADNKPIVK